MGGLLILLVAWVIMVAAAVTITRRIFRFGQTAGIVSQPTTARQILDQRYARGEITRQQYLLMNKDIR